MRRCIECGRPYKDGLNGIELLELGLNELSESDLENDHIKNITRIRALLRKTSAKVEGAISDRTEDLAALVSRES